MKEEGHIPTYSCTLMVAQYVLLLSLVMLVTVFGRVKGNFATVGENHYLTYNSHIYRAVRSSAANICTHPSDMFPKEP